MTYILFARAGEQRQKDNEEKTVEPDTKKEQQKCIFLTELYFCMKYDAVLSSIGCESGNIEKYSYIEDYE